MSNHWIINGQSIKTKTIDHSKMNHSNMNLAVSKHLKQSKIKDSISAKKAEKWLESEYVPEGWFSKSITKSGAIKP